MMLPARAFSNVSMALQVTRRVAEEACGPDQSHHLVRHRKGLPQGQQTGIVDASKMGVMHAGHGPRGFTAACGLKEGCPSSPTAFQCLPLRSDGQLWAAAQHESRGETRDAKRSTAVFARCLM